MSTAMKKPALWKSAILSSALIFQLFFVSEIFFFRDVIIVDPSRHMLSYESWSWIVKEWAPPEFWRLYYEPITKALSMCNLLFQLLFGIFLIYIFLHRKQFSLQGKIIVLTAVALVLLDLSIRIYIRYNIYVYRQYMYSSFNEIMALYLLYCCKRYRGTTEAL